MNPVRFEVTLTLFGPVLTHASTAGKVGIDAPFARRAADDLCYLPFSLIKGRLRQSWEELALPDLELWFGPRHGGWSASRGRLRFRDFAEVPARARQDSAEKERIRHRIRIDPATGAADDGALQFIESPFAPGERVVFRGEIDGVADDPETLRNELEAAFRWTPSFGAERTIGFGRMAAVSVAILPATTPAAVPVSPVAESDGAIFDVSIEISEPFCLARRRIDENLFSSDDVIPGSVLRGVAATTLNAMLGRPSSMAIESATGTDWADLAAHFNEIRFSHAFPSEDGRRPRVAPLSIVRDDDQWWDVALCDGPVLIGGQAPRFTIDWKRHEWTDLRQALPWPEIEREVRVRTAIDRDTRRAADRKLFAYEMIVPDRIVWRGTADFSPVPAGVRDRVRTQLAALFATEPAAFGKSKARGKVTFTQRTAAERLAQSGASAEPWVVTLQTPALLCDPATLDESSGRDELFAAYQQAFDDISGGTLRLLRFFAAQSLAGGYLVHRFRQEKEYAPFLLTDPGSVFVLEATGESRNGRTAAEVIAAWQTEPLPLPGWAVLRYGAGWRTNPFLPDDGFGEVAINLPCHRDPRHAKAFAPIETWTAPETTPREPATPRGAAPRQEIAANPVKDATFDSRWRITGRLTTTTDFHLGSGESAPPHDELTRKESDGRVAIEISGVAADGNGRAYIPGSSLKGALRSWLTRRGIARETVERVFGSAIEPAEKEKILVGGKAEFLDSFATGVSTEMPHVPYWRSERATGIVAGVAIDRWTRTAEDKKLFHREVVPAGVSFDVAVTGHDLSDDDVALLLVALRSFSDPGDPVTLGAETGSGWGRFTWGTERVETLGRDALATWRAGSHVGYAGMSVADASRFQKPIATVRETLGTSDRLTIAIDIRFDGPFLVNEPRLTKESKDDPRELPNHAPRVDAEGRITLPVSSFRGALRAQAERIARTLRLPACRATDPETACKPITDAKESRKLCVTCRLFGATGWASPIELSPFHFEGNAAPFHQELVAVDRFTGGSSSGAKFTVEGRWAPRFTATASVDRKRAGDDALHLLALALRDLEEGDVSLGFGASKGYGSCRATIRWPGAPVALTAQETAKTTASTSPAENRGGVVLPIGVASQTDHFHNPYHFVPASAAPRPDDIRVDAFLRHEHLGHDVYADGTYSGRLVCRLTTVTPMVVGATQRKREEEGLTTIVDPYVEPGTERVMGEDVPGEGIPAIPATSLRGLLSSIAEAASNSAMRVLDDQHYSYRASMRESLQAVGMIVGSGAGRRLRPLALPALHGTANQDGSFTARIPDAYLTMFPRPLLKKFVNGYVTNRNVTPPVVQLRSPSFLQTTKAASYCADFREYWWAALPDWEYDAERHTLTIRDARLSKDRNWLIGYDATDRDPLRAKPAGDNYTRGILRVLGIEGRDKEIPTTKKHEIFVPYPEEMEKGATFEAAGAIAEFERLAAERTSADPSTPFHVKGSQRNAHGKTTAIELRDGDLVFFEPADDGKSVKHVAISSIWRREIGATTYKFFSKLSRELIPFNRDREVVTIAEQLFGFVNASDEKGHAANDSPRALASRVRISAARLHSASDDSPFLDPVPLRILDSPKPPSPALYFRPSAAKGYVAKSQLRVGAHEPQGRKFYLHHAWWDARQPPWETRHPDADAKQKNLVRPLRAGCSFFFHIDFDNVTERELGLLCYAVRPTEAFLHKLGMGKPIGLGSVTIDPVGLFLIDRARRYRNAEAPRRYHFAAAAENEVPDAWPDAYVREREAVKTAESTHSFAQFREMFRNTMSPEIRDALELLGDPTKVVAPVHTPQVAAESDLETKTFQWFVANDKEHHDYLEPLTPGAPLPVLSRSGTIARQTQVALPPPPRHPVGAVGPAGRPAAEKRLPVRQDNRRPPVQAPPRLTIGKVVTCTMLEKKSKAGSPWFAIAGETIPGIANDNDVPPELQVGAVVKMQIKTIGNPHQLKWIDQT